MGLFEILNSGSEFLVEVEFMEFTKDGILRFPSFKGVRSDVNRADCTFAQVTS